MKSTSMVIWAFALSGTLPVSATTREVDGWGIARTSGYDCDEARRRVASLADVACIGKGGYLSLLRGCARDLFSSRSNLRFMSESYSLAVLRKSIGKHHKYLKVLLK